MAVIQNNRNFKQSEFLAAYETLLEEMSDGFRVNPEKIALHTQDWSMTISSEAFIGMSRSSTQVQRAIASYQEKYLQKLSTLIKQYEVQGNLEILYRSELYMYAR